ncbi:hypothetical protein Clacol_006104 [Clathrus columnatus]|uniref:Transcriptional adapter 3 n=1 Tax=Clathrus columnatus TaxID=1419009 RepID=A0AAV5AB48_9AGAM|nr:hypothetical protein Clacol_006104 [Clathrus columnatus]
MSHHFTPYPTVSALRSQLLTGPPPSVPSIENLLNLQAELKLLGTKSLSRYKKAESDLRALEHLYRQCKDKDKDRDKSKIRDKIKVKRETTETSDANFHSVPASTPSSVPSGGYGVKVISGAKTLPGPVSAIKDKLKKEKDRVVSLEKDKKKDFKKKKRKREDEESDVEELLAADRHKKPKRSPEPPPSVVVHKHKSPAKPPHAPSVSTSSSNFFALPRHVLHIPQRPTPNPIPVPGPSSPRQVNEDFSKQKTPQQTAIATFWSYVEPWLRPIREEDVGLLEWDGDEETPFIVPPLGRHYTELWDDEDNGRFLALTGSPIPTPKTASLSKWDPLTIQESDLLCTDKGHALGPVHERLLSAILPVPVLADGRPAASGNVKPSLNGGPRCIDPVACDDRIGKLKPFDGDKQPPKVNIQDMQERLIKELRSFGLLGDEEPDYSKTPDDPLAAELRQCQRQLRAQMALNKARRQRLCEVAKVRLARNEFEEHLAALERSILAKYNQLQKRDMPKQAKKKKKSGGAGGGAHVVPDGPFLPPPHIHGAAWGLEKDDESVLGIDEELNNMILMRQRFIDVVQPCVDVKERQRPGTLYGSPQESIYRGIQIPRTTNTNGKGPG